MQLGVSGGYLRLLLLKDKAPTDIYTVCLLGRGRCVYESAVSATSFRLVDELPCSPLVTSLPVPSIASLAESRTATFLQMILPDPPSTLATSFGLQDLTRCTFTHDSELFTKNHCVDHLLRPNVPGESLHEPIPKPSIRTASYTPLTLPTIHSA